MFDLASCMVFLLKYIYMLMFGVGQSTNSYRAGDKVTYRTA